MCFETESLSLQVPHTPLARLPLLSADPFFGHSTWLNWNWDYHDLRLLLLGFVIGLTFGPLVDLLFLTRRAWARGVARLEAHISGQKIARPTHLLSYPQDR